MASSKGVITRKEVIEDGALTWGPEYAKQVQVAIDKNKEFVKGVLEISVVQKMIKEASNNSAYIKSKEREIELGRITTEVWKEQIAAENQLISLKRKNELATESTNKAVIKERIALAESTKALKQQARESLGMVSAYEKLTKARNDSQKKLADLLSAEKKNTAEIIIAQKEFDKLDARVRAVDTSIRNYSRNIGNYQSALKGLNETLRNLISTFGIVTGMALFGQIVKDIYHVLVDFDKQLIAVGKTTNISGEDLKQFGRDVVELGDKLDGVSVDGLLKSAEIAGQLGVSGTANILKFSEAIEKLKLTSNIISNEQVASFAKFIEVSSDSFENADRLASVITQLGNNFATMESEVLANSTEIQKGIAVYNASAQGVLALGAATSSLGSEAEVSASSIQKTFGVINNAIATGKNLEKVLKLTGLTEKEMSKQFNKDATGVFVKFVKGLNTAKKEGENLALVLGEVGLNEVRTFKTIGSLAANYELLQKAMNYAQQEYVENIALNKEVAAASESVASIVGDIRDKWEAYILTMDDANQGTLSLAIGLKFVRDNFKDIINWIAKGGTVLLTFIGVMKVVNYTMITFSALQTAWTAGQIRFALATGIGTKSILAQAAAARAAMVAQNGLNVAVTATPWGLILAFLSAAIVAYMIFNDEMTDAEKNIHRIVEANKELEKSEKSYAESRDKSNGDRFKTIEDDIKLRKAQGENSDKLDKEEIARKKQIIQASLDVYTDLKKLELERTQVEINNSRQRVAQFQLEKKALDNARIRVSKQGRTSEDLDQLIQAEKEKLDLKKSSLSQNAKLTKEEQSRLNKQLQDLDKDAAVKDAEFKKELSKKEEAERKKRLKAIYDAEKKAQDDLFKLQQFRLQVAIDIDEEILGNDIMSYDKRLDALYGFTQLASDKIRNAAEFELSQLGKYNENTGKLIRELSDLEIKTLIETGDIKRKLTAGQLLIIEKFQDDQKKIVMKGAKDRQKIIDSEVDEIKKRIDTELLLQDTKLNQALEAENILFNASLNKNSDLEKAQEEHERRILEIKRAFAKEGLAIQIKAIDDLLEAQNQLPDNEKISADKRVQIDNDLARLKKENSDINVENNDVANKKISFFEQENFRKIEDRARELHDVLVDLGNAIFDGRIQKIEEDQVANDEYYAKQIELAKNDERQKGLLQKKRDKKNDELEKKKRKEQHKQAVFNKASAVAQAGINTALAVLAALNTQPFLPMGPIMAALAGGIGAVQIASIVATPIPKYKDGRKGGPKEAAMINDGGVTEVVESKDGTAKIYSGKNRIVQLYKGDTVHKSFDDYNKLQRATMMASLNMEGRNMSEFQASQYFEASYGKELLQEMKLTRKAIQNQKQPFYKGPKIDIPHVIWKSKNTNW
ncbi:hypothetical protein IUY40_02685 [Flavobacterium sp. ALJ2]|uniref:hypothetical protein n=1 Tax=Flavobacterium sp. ALJ2 TaxID=2786960 RepID=UPI00189E7189|nr:hypothetical protein [Flavobacterium sp. ALJ2]MBF7090451.1 hypothetical protein [Flavobacterium sp. ALJ2]